MSYKLETAAVPLPKVKLVESDGEPFASDWHRDAISLLIAIVRYFCRERSDYYVAGSTCIYYSVEQARKRDLCAPAFFLVDGVPSMPPRPYWAVWLEGGRYPDLIMELLSPAKAETDRTANKALYEKTFKTLEYFCYDPSTRTLEGWRLLEGDYGPIQADDKGRLFSKKLGIWLGTWEGAYHGTEALWLRFFDAQGNLVPTFDETAEERAAAEYLRAEAEHERAEAERLRAEAAEAEVARLKAQLDDLRTTRT